MAIWILKPTERDGNEFTGPVMTFENSNSGTDIINEFISSGNANVTVPNAGVPEDVLSSLNWYDSGYTGSSVGYGFFLAQVSGVGGSGVTTPTIANVNSSELITEVLHSSHSNSANGLAYDTTGTANYHYNSSSLSISTANETISLNYAANGQTTFAPNTKSRTLDNDNGNVYVNGILYASQQGQSGNQGSGNEGLAWYQQEASPTYITGITENNLFDNITSVHNKKKSFLRASKTIADETSTALLEKYTKLINLKLLDRLIEVDDYRDAERYALSKLTATEQATIKNLTRYS